MTENLILTDEKQEKKNSILLQQLQSPRDQPNPLCWWEVAPLEQNLRMFRIKFLEVCLNN